MADDRWLMAADVHLANRSDLFARLGVPDYRQLSDAGLLFRYWRCVGDGYLADVVGEYAIATYDRARRRLTLTRDPTGQRPLYYARRISGIAFASMPSGLRVLLEDSGPELDQLASDLALVPHESERTVFAGIERVRPGESLVCEDLTVRRTNWEPNFEADVRSSDAEQIERFRELLGLAVHSRMSEGSSATHLSSGWDSNAVTATAARLSAEPRRLWAFTAAPLEGPLGALPRGRYADETKIAEAAARYYGVQHRVVRETAPIHEVMRRYARLCQLPILSPFNVAWWVAIRAQAKAAGARVILTGELGNLTLSTGGLASLGDLTRMRRWDQWWHEARSAANRPDVRWRGILLNSFGYHMPSPVYDALLLGFQQIAEGRGANFLHPCWRDAIRERGADRYRPSGNSYRDRWRKLRVDDVGPWRLAAIADQGIEERDPTSDRRLIEFSMRLPPDQLIRDGQSRPLAREGLRDRVPAIVLQAQNRGLQSADWHLRLNQSQAYELLEEISGNVEVGELIDLAAVRSAIDRWPADDWNKGFGRITYSMDLPAVLATGIFLTEMGRFVSPDTSLRI
ncbi:asparagine synthetase B family protein [Sphingomonas limnosediminicola]|uniref:asparagine synthetase B family protein n=1 Tax=Sphingomonas flavescens TaxID=3132797 RepID=UPI0028056D1F|nr:asparagine synthetase B family protein [Sphingomonas limnosediminicola]